MAEITSLEEAVGGLIGDGDTIAMEGFTHLIPHAAGHQVIRARPLTKNRSADDSHKGYPPFVRRNQKLDSKLGNRMRKSK